MISNDDIDKVFDQPIFTNNPRIFLARIYYNSIFLAKEQDRNKFAIGLLLNLYAIFKTPKLFVDGMFPQKRLDQLSLSGNGRRGLNECKILSLPYKIRMDPFETFKIETTRRHKSFALYLRLKKKIKSDQGNLMMRMYEKIKILEKKNNYLYFLPGLEKLHKIVDDTVFYNGLSTESEMSIDNKSWNFKPSYKFN